MFQRFRERLAAAKLEWDVSHGRKTWGRVQSPGRAVLSAKIIRADGTVEDLGVIAEMAAPTRRGK